MNDPAHLTESVVEPGPTPGQGAPSSQPGSCVLSLLCGSVQVLGFAPLGWLWLSLPVLALWLNAQGRKNAWAATKQAWWFGLGLYLGGVSWVYVSVHVYGGAPAWLGVVLVVVLAAYLASYAAVAVGLAWWLSGSPLLRVMLVLPCCWFLAEWGRATVLGGFSWLGLGYQMVGWPGSAGLLAVIGLPGLNMLLLLVAGALSQVLAQPKITTVVLVVVGTCMLSLPAPADWTSPRGRMLPAGVVQGNVSQDQKWRPANLLPTMQTYAELTDGLAPGSLVVWPEVAIAASRYRVEGYFQERQRQALAREQTVLAGVITRSEGRSYNTVYALGEQPGRYVKQHLVPFGEYFPVPGWIRPILDWLELPFSDIRTDLPGDDYLYADGVPLLMSICFEDVFPADMARRAGASEILINVTNDAWFAGSLAPRQHLQIAQARAAEAGRSLIRAANTGISAFIGPNGELQQQLPWGERGVLVQAVQPRTGLTPYLRWRDGPLSVLSIGLIVALLIRRIVKMRRFSAQTL